MRAAGRAPPPAPRTSSMHASSRSPRTALAALALTVLALAVGPAPALAASRAPDDVADDLDARLRPLVEEALAVDATPGLQVAVVFADGRTWSDGFGIADLDTGRPVTRTTRFYIASTTKALTALAAARLDARGELDLDATLAEALPDAPWPADAHADDVTVRDLLTHTHGLSHPALGFRVAFTGQYTVDSFVDALADVRSGPRSFRYTNFGYDIVGVILDRERTRGWTDVVAREVLEPLGMTRTTAHISEVPADELAMPHEHGAHGPERIDLRKGDANMGPAGGHVTTADDLARLLLAELTGGVLDGEQVVPAEVIAETQRAQVVQERTFLHYVRHAWGLGWDIGTLDGETVLHRPGGFAGYYSNAAFFPEHGFGVAVLVNGGSTSAVLAEDVVAAIVDTLLGRRDALVRHARRLEDLGLQLAGARERLASRPAPPPVTDAPTRAWDAYVGDYAHEMFGTITVERTDDGLRMTMGPMASTLLPLADDADAFRTTLFGDDDVAAFEGGATDGAPAALRFRSEPGAAYARR